MKEEQELDNNHGTGCIIVVYILPSLFALNRAFLVVLFLYMQTVHVEIEACLTAFQGNITLETASEGSKGV